MRTAPQAPDGGSEAEACQALWRAGPAAMVQRRPVCMSCTKSLLECSPAVAVRARKESRARPVCCRCASCLPCTRQCVTHRALSPALQRSYAPVGPGHSCDGQHAPIVACLALPEGYTHCSSHPRVHSDSQSQEVSCPRSEMLVPICLSDSSGFCQRPSDWGRAEAALIGTGARCCHER